MNRVTQFCLYSHLDWEFSSKDKIYLHFMPHIFGAIVCYYFHIILKKNSQCNVILECNKCPEIAKSPQASTHLSPTVTFM